jgi:hypothetical protein
MGNIVSEFTSLILLAAFGTGSALAQYGGGGMGGGPTSGTYTAPKSGYGSSSGAAIGIGLGAAAGAGLAFWALHNRPSVVGCVQRSDHGNALFNEKDGKTYNLLPASDVSLSPGERVALKGKKTKDESGNYSFEAVKLVKDYGACEAKVARSSLVAPAH